MESSTSAVPTEPLPQSQDVLSEVLRVGAQRLLAQAIDGEVTEWIEQHQHLKDEAGRRWRRWRLDACRPLALLSFVVMLRPAPVLC